MKKKLQKIGKIKECKKKKEEILGFKLLVKTVFKAVSDPNK